MMSESISQTIEEDNLLLSNDEIKHRVHDVFANFTSDVDPEPLSDWLIQYKIISREEWEENKNTGSTRRSRCRNLLNHLLGLTNPRAFEVVKLALEKEHHWLFSIFKQHLCPCKQKSIRWEDKYSTDGEKLDQDDDDKGNVAQDERKRIEQELKQKRESLEEEYEVFQQERNELQQERKELQQEREAIESERRMNVSKEQLHMVQWQRKLNCIYFTGKTTVGRQRAEVPSSIVS